MKSRLVSVDGNCCFFAVAYQLSQNIPIIEQYNPELFHTISAQVIHPELLSVVLCKLVVEEWR